VKSAAFEYTRAASVGEACELLARHGDDAKLLAGGQSLVPMMAMRLVRPAWLIDINEVGSLKSVSLEANQARVGACARQVDVERDDGLAARVPLLRQGLGWVGHVQTRNRGTIGGSLVHADPCAELPLVAQVLEARMLLRSSSGKRATDARSFFAGPMTTTIRADELLEEIEWPVWPGRRTGSAFEELAIRQGDFAIVAAAAQVALDGEGRCTRAAFGLGGVGQTPLAFPKLAKELVGAPLKKDLIQEIARRAAAESEPGSDLHASAEYRSHLARVLLARVLTDANAEALRH
jgi:CO/xanthine dehydrogenase FAD-binding subunit